MPFREGEALALWVARKHGLPVRVSLQAVGEHYRTRQNPDGSWRERFPGVPDTCFALLFLQRANIVKDLTDKLRQARRLAAAAQPGRPAPQGRKE